MIGANVHRRLRLASVTVNPTVLFDDGVNLTPVPVSGMTVPAAQLDDLPGLLRDAIGKLQEQIPASPAPEQLIYAGEAPPEENIPSDASAVFAN